MTAMYPRSWPRCLGRAVVELQLDGEQAVIAVYREEVELLAEALELESLEVFFAIECQSWFDGLEVVEEVEMEVVLAVEGCRLCFNCARAFHSLPALWAPAVGAVLVMRNWFRESGARPERDRCMRLPFSSDPGA